MRVLAVVQDAQDRAVLAEVARAESWRLQCTRDFAEARPLLESGAQFAVVILDAADWRSVLGEVRLLSPEAVVAVAGAAAWEEVVEMGGYGVLPRPFRTAEVARSLMHAGWFAASRCVRR